MFGSYVVAMKSGKYYSSQSHFTAETSDGQRFENIQFSSSICFEWIPSVLINHDGLWESMRNLEREVPFLSFVVVHLILPFDMTVLCLLFVPSVAGGQASRWMSNWKLSSRKKWNSPPNNTTKYKEKKLFASLFLEFRSFISYWFLLMLIVILIAIHHSFFPPHLKTQFLWL